MLFLALKYYNIQIFLGLLKSLRFINLYLYINKHIILGFWCIFAFIFSYYQCILLTALLISYKIFYFICFKFLEILIINTVPCQKKVIKDMFFYNKCRIVCLNFIIKLHGAYIWQFLFNFKFIIENHAINKLLDFILKE